MLKIITILALLSATFGAFADDFSSNVVGDCSALARESIRENVRILIIGIEGTNEFVASDADALFTYASALKSGPVTQGLPPLRPDGGLLTDGLLFPLLREFGGQIDAISIDFNNPFSNGWNDAVSCARRWTALPGHKVMIFGHSTGAQQALQLAGTFYQDRIPVDTLVTIDAIPLMNIFTGVPQITRPPGVAHYLNFFQHVDSNHFYRGQSATNADVNQMVNDVQGHFTVTASKTIFRDVSAAVSESLESK